MLPVYVLAFVNVNVPEPNFVNVPVPVVIAAIDDVPTLSTVNPKVLPVTPPDNVNDEPVSICTSDAANMVTAPVQMLLPETFRITPLVETPDPRMEMGSATVIPPDTSIDELFAVLIDVEPADVPSDAAFETCTTPAEIVVAPT